MKGNDFSNFSYIGKNCIIALFSIINFGYLFVSGYAILGVLEKLDINNNII